MRALLLATLLLAPLAMGMADAQPRGDLIVTLREDGAAAMPAPAVPLAVLPGYVLLDATPADAARLAQDPAVARLDWARPLERHAAPTLPARALHGLTRADAGGLTGAGVTVAVLDSGVDASHPDLAGRVEANVRLVGGRFVDAPGDADGHGTHVAGVLAASGASSEGRWRGVAPDARLVGVDISDRFTTASAVLAYDWLYLRRHEHDIRVVVNAWGRVDDGEPYDPRDPELRAIQRLVDAGVVVLFSASNRGPAPGTLSIEAQHPGVITVGATDAAGVLMAYSSRGPVEAPSPWVKPDVVAPGDGVVGPRSAQSLPRDADPDALHTVYSGTSQSVPHVGGIVARMLQARPDLTPEEVAYALRASAIDLGAEGPDDATGYGLVDAHDAVRVARGLPPDRGNVLIRGGTDRHEDAARLTPTPQRGLLDLVQRPQVAWEAPFPVKPGAERVRVRVAAEGADSLQVELVKDGRVLRASEVESPDPGVWTMRLRAALPLATSARMMVEADLPPNPARALAFDGAPPAPRERGSVAREAATDAWLGVKDAAPVLIACLSGALLVAALWPPRPPRRKLVVLRRVDE